MTQTLARILAPIAACVLASLALLTGQVFLTLLMAMLAFENWRMRPR